MGKYNFSGVVKKNGKMDYGGVSRNVTKAPQEVSDLKQSNPQYNAPKQNDAAQQVQDIAKNFIKDATGNKANVSLKVSNTTQKNNWYNELFEKQATKTTKGWENWNNKSWDKETIESPYVSHPQAAKYLAEDITNLGKGLGKIVWGGIGKSYSGTLSFIDMLIPDGVQPEFVTNFLKKEKSYGEKFYQEGLDVTRNSGPVGRVIGEAAVELSAMLPDVLLSMASGGMNKLNSVASALPKATQYVKNLIKNPAYWSSFTQIAGHSYNDAINSGASENQARAMGTLNGVIGSAIEVGGGVQKLPGKVINKSKGGLTTYGNKLFNNIKNFVVDTMAEEGGEEVIQNFIGEALEMIVYDHNKELYSTTDENALMNPKREVKAFGMGALVGGMGGAGGQFVSSFVGNKATPSTETQPMTPNPQNTTVKAPVSTEGGINLPVTQATVESAMERILNGTATNKDIDLFKPANAKNRAIFENATGVKLPETNSLTRKFLRGYAENQTADTTKAEVDTSTVQGVKNDLDVKNTEPTMSVQDAQMYNIATSNLIRKARENNLDLQTFYAETENVNAYNLTEQDIQTINNAFAKMFGNNVDENTQGNLNILSKIANKYPVNVNSSQQTATMAEGQNVSNIPLYDDFKETILKQYPNMPEDAIQEAYKGYYGLTDEGSNDIINNNDVYYQRREDNGPQGRYNGNGNEQSRADFESTDSVRTEGYQFRNGRDYKNRRTGLWQKAYGRVSGTLKKTTPKYIRTHAGVVMFSEYDNANSVKQFFKDVYNRDVIVCKDTIIDKSFVNKNSPEFEASAAYVQGKILVSLDKDSETYIVHEMIHEGQNDIEYENAVTSIKKLMDMNALDNHILEKESDYGNTYENRVSFDDDILYETYADIISRLATKEWREYGSRSELFEDKESYNRAKEIAEDYVAYLINNPPQKNIDTIIKDFSEFENDFADDYMFEKSESNPYFALKESEADDALAYMEQNYGEMYRNLIKEYGTIEKGMQPRVNDIDVPVQSGKGQYVSEFARTMAETKVFADAMDGEFEKMVVDGTLSHERITDKKAYNEAEQKIKKDGFEDSVKRFEFLVEEGRLNKNDIAMGQMLLNLACQNKDVKLAKKLAVDLSVAATQFGQNVQAFSMLKRMSPDGQLYYLEKSVEKINQEILEKYKDVAPVEIDNKLAEDLLNAKTEEELNKAVYAIEKNIGEQIPASKMDKWNAWRYLAMLGNTRTHFRNIVGNAVFTPTRAIKNIIGTGIEGMVLPQAERTKSLTKTEESKQFAEEDWKVMAETVKGNEGKYGTRRGIEEHRKIFKTKWLEAARKFNTNALEIEDGWFLEPAYKSAFAQAMTARGLTAEFLNSGTKEATEALHKIREYAISEAKRATFRDTNAFSAMVSNMKFRKTDHISQKAADRGNIFVEGVLPFKKTPANILVRGVEYSPIGLVKGFTDVLINVKRGKISAAKAIDNISAGLTGTAICALGALMAHLGWLVVSPDEDDEVAGYKKMLGAQNYSIKIGEHSYTIDWMSPTAMPLFVGAEIVNTFKNTENFNLKTVTDALTRIAEPAFELSCLSGIQSALESIKYAEGAEIVAELAGSMALSYVQQAIPTLGGQIARAVDDIKRNAYYKDKNSNLPEFMNSFIQQTAAKIPFASRMLPEKIDRWGRTERYGRLPERVLENFVSPGYYSNNKSTWTDDKLMELYEKTGDSAILPDVAKKSFMVDGKTKYLSADEYVKYSKELGQMSYKYITEFLKAPNTMDAETKADVIKALYEYSNAKAKEKVSDYELPVKYNNVEKAVKRGMSPAAYYYNYYKKKSKK